MDSIAFILDNGLKLVIGGWIDYCIVTLKDANNKVLPIKFGELKKGLFDFTDTNCDEQNDF